jgi:hypothetical protein
MLGKYCGLVLCLLVCVGCAPDAKIARMRGEVTINAQPVERGSIAFFPVDGNTKVTGTEIVAGKFSSEIPVGESKVEIRVPRKTGTKKLYDTPDSPTQDTFEEVLPEKYNSKTELRVTAKPGTNQQNFALTTP